MKQSLKLSLAMAVSLSASMLSVAQADDSIVNTKAYLGGKTINDDAWRAQEEHGSMGILSDFYMGSHGLRLAVDLFGTGSEDATSSEVKGTYTAEAQVGLRKYFEWSPRFQPYVSGGINFAYATQTNNDGSGNTEQEDMDAGLWVNSGIDYLITDRITAGFDLRYATADVELFDESVNLNALSTGFTLGYRW